MEPSHLGLSFLVMLGLRGVGSMLVTHVEPTIMETV
jgi:hypothetical protein